MKRLLCALMICASPVIQAADEPFSVPDLVVITHPAAGVEKLDRNEVVNLFFGRHRQLPSGIPAIPLDQPSTSQERTAFYAMLVGKNLSEINAYWARLVFSGRMQPPRQTISSSELLSLVRDNRGAVGYVDRQKSDSRVKVVYELGK